MEIAAENLFAFRPSGWRVAVAFRGSLEQMQRHLNAGDFVTWIKNHFHRLTVGKRVVALKQSHLFEQHPRRQTLSTIQPHFSTEMLGETVS